jgi:hypothetical protein
MNDYLSNLAIRSLSVGEQNTTSLFHPRLPSLFESPGRAGEFSDATSIEQIEETIPPFRTIFSAPDNQKFVKDSQQVDAGLNFTSNVHLDPLVPEMNTHTAASQKHREFVSSYPKLNPLPVDSRPHSLSPQMDHREKQEPVIQVHIGRIEVRAVTASRPTSSKTSSAPNLTLEQYLRQRNEGKR